MREKHQSPPPPPPPRYSAKKNVFLLSLVKRLSLKVQQVCKKSARVKLYELCNLLTRGNQGNKNKDMCAENREKYFYSVCSVCR